MHSVILLQYAIKLDLFSLLAYNYNYNIYIRHIKGYKMFVLSIIGVIALIIGIYLLTIKLNQISYKNYNYEFFSLYPYAIFSLMYILLYFGRKFYIEAALRDGDIWNGILLFSFGVIVFIIRFIKNIKIAGFFKGILYTIVQLIIYLPIAIFGFIAILFAMVVFANSKPVYNINSK